MAVCYAKTAAIGTFIAHESYYGDAAMILDWVYYYDVLSKFGIRHYKQRWDSMVSCAKKQHLAFVEKNAQENTIVSVYFIVMLRGLTMP
jgi:hypothetical protein